MIIGAMKCGTTSLFDFLKEHPEICPSVTKEPDYFSENIGNKEFKQGEYMDLFNCDVDKHKCTLEASVSYTKFPLEKNAARRIKEYNLNPKFIYILRNPCERIESHYNYMRNDKSWKSKIDSTQLIDSSNYYMQLQNFGKYFPRERFLLLSFEELKMNPETILMKVFSFIGVSTEYKPISFSNSNKTKLINKSGSLLKQKFAFLTPLIPAKVKMILSKRIDRLFKRKKIILTNAQKKNIYDVLFQDMLRLQRDYGFDISKWGFNSK